MCDHVEKLKEIDDELIVARDLLLDDMAEILERGSVTIDEYKKLSLTCQEMIVALRGIIQMELESPAPKPSKPNYGWMNTKDVRHV